MGLTKELNAPNYLVVLAVVSVSLNGSAIYREGTSVIKVKNVECIHRVLLGSFYTLGGHLELYTCGRKRDYRRESEI